MEVKESVIGSVILLAVANLFRQGGGSLGGFGFPLRLSRLKAASAWSWRSSPSPPEFSSY